MQLADITPLSALVVITVIFMTILLGPSIYSSYINWKMRRR
jgi:hypothetical protein